MGSSWTPGREPLSADRSQYSCPDPSITSPRRAPANTGSSQALWTPSTLIIRLFFLITLPPRPSSRYDCNSSNYRLPLRKGADVGPKQVEVLPKPLCDKYAWVRWDFDGRPNRSEQQAQAEYDRGVQVGMGQGKGMLARRGQDGMGKNRCMFVLHACMWRMEQQHDELCIMINSSTAPAFPRGGHAHVHVPLPATHWLYAQTRVLLQEMKDLMAKGRSLDELWRVAEGKWKYNDYRDKVIRPSLGDNYLQRQREQQQREAAPPPQQQQQAAPQANGNGNGNGNGAAAVVTISIPDDLIGVQAYVLWEHAGKPQGADFSGDAKRAIEEKLRNGQTLEQIAQQLNYTPKWTSSSSSASFSSMDEGPKSKEKAAPPPPPPKQNQPPQVGSSMHAPKRNPLDMIKVCAAHARGDGGGEGVGGSTVGGCQCPMRF